ncbi:3-hydroxyisobutyrate dehydrogenase [Agrobacterium sp. NPDC090273]|uniref:3-hydroxyisobutyrate dehydrogenase n=1 Tax=Agrobacterium sp. NPDC090273 TaxID=3363919 RepID=UPI00383BF347
MQIAFIGLGTMGGHMARNLLRKGFDVVGFDLSADAVAGFEADGGRTAADPRTAISKAEVVFTMLPNDLVLESLFLADPSFLEGVAAGTLFVDCSSVSVDVTKKLALSVEQFGAATLDAPVSGGPIGARNGTLTFMVGGDVSQLERVTPLLEAMGTSIVHMGDHGAGQVAKQCNNMLAAIIMTGTAEAIGMGVRNGLDPSALTKVMQSSTGGSNLLTRWNPWPGVDPDAPASNDYKSGFQLGLMLKDLDLALDCAQSSRYTTPMGALARSLYSMCSNLESGSALRDFSYISRLYRS